MKLPVMKVPDGTILSVSTCDDGAHCAECPLHGVADERCSGCSTNHRLSMEDRYKECHRECHECAGYKVDVTAVCCRSPLRDTYMTAVTRTTDWSNPKYSYAKRPVLEFDVKTVPYISSGGVNTIAPGDTLLIPESVPVVAVNLSRVWGGNGFYSQDLKDYLHLSPNTKLILACMTLDNVLEKAWEKELYADPNNFRNVNIDYWMPLAVSAYAREPHMHQFYQTCRTLLMTEQSEAWWTTGDHMFTGIKTNDLILECVKKIPQMVFNTQFVEERLIKHHLRQFKKYHELIPKRTPFWFVGSSTPQMIHNIRRVCGSRPLYFMSSSSFYLASKGQAIKSNGKPRKSKIPKLQLVEENIKTFEAIAQRWS